MAGDCHGFYGEKHGMWYAGDKRKRVEIMVSGCIFDMDGLLFDTERIFQNYWRAIAAERGIVLADSFITEITGTSGEMMNRILKNTTTRRTAGKFKKTAKKGFCAIWQRMYLSKRERWKYSDAAACLVSKPR